MSNIQSTLSLKSFFDEKVMSSTKMVNVIECFSHNKFNSCDKFKVTKLAKSVAQCMPCGN